MTRKKRSPTKPSQTLDAQRGTQLWAFNHYRSRMLTSLLNDLVSLESWGLDDRVCAALTLSLEYFTNACTEIPRGGLLTGPLYKEAERLTQLYKEWNAILGIGPEQARQRRRKLEELRKQRQRLSNRARSLQFELAQDLDRKLLADTYNAIGGLLNLVPDLFKNLGAGFADFLKRGGQTP